MNKNFNISADFKNSEGKVNVKVVLFCFKEGEHYITYSPHLEVSGYGKTEGESIESFNYCLGEFLDYTVNKKTLHKELVRLGWEVKKGSPKRLKKVVAPSWDSLLKTNSSLEELLNNQDLRTSHKEVAIPV